MPAQQGLRLDDEQGLPPGTNPAGQQHQERAVRWRRNRARDAPAQHEQLLAQERVLGEQLRPAAHQVCPDPRRVCRHRRPYPEAATECVPHAGDEPDQPTAAPTHDHHRLATPFLRPTT